MTTKTRPERLRQARRRAGLTQRAAADKLGVSKAAISNWERGAFNPHYTRFKEIAWLYGIPLSDLFD